MRSTLFDPISIEDQHFLLASHLPPGDIWRNAFDPEDDFGKMFLGLAVEFYRFQVLEKKLFTEMDIDEAEELLTNWEKSVGLPDSCFDINVNSTQRRKQIDQKFSKFGGVQTKADFIRVADFFGFPISILTGKAVGTFPLQFPVLFFTDTKAAVHTLFIIVQDVTAGSKQFALPFPIPFSVGGKSFLQCIFNKLAPANVNVIVVNEGDI